MKHLKRNILAITLASMHIMGSGYNVDALETKTTSNNIVRTITYMEVTGNSVNVRTGPSTSYKSIMKLNKGDKVEYISSSGNWSKIRYNEKEGYISNTYIKSVSTTSTSTDIRIITGNSVNFRKGPGTNYSVIKSFNKGTKVEFISKENDWVKVNYNGTVGYVFSKYVSDKTNTDNKYYTLSELDINNINKLVEEKYNTWDWNFGHSPKYSLYNELRYPGGNVEFNLNVEGGIIKDIKFFGDFFGKCDISHIENLLLNTKHEEESLKTILNSININDYFLGADTDVLVSGIMGVK